MQVLLLNGRHTNASHILVKFLNFFTFFFHIDLKIVKTLKKIILTTEQFAKHLFADRNTQHLNSTA